MIPGQVSIIIPCFNAQRYVAETIESVLAQTYRSFEIIAVNDGSTDATHEVLERYRDRATILMQANAGRSAARNAGLARAQGEYVLFLDSDDLIHPEHFQRLVEAILRSGADIAYCRADAFLSENPDVRYRYRHRYYEGENADRILLGNYISMHSGLIRRRILDETAIRFTVGREKSEDWEFWCRLILQGAKVVLTKGISAHIRHHTANSSRDMIPIYEEQLRILDTLENDYPLQSAAPGGQKLFVASRAHLSFQIATIDVFLGNRRKGLSGLFKSLKRFSLLRVVDMARIPGLLLMSLIQVRLPIAITRIVFGQHCAAKQRVDELPAQRN